MSSRPAMPVSRRSFIGGSAAAISAAGSVGAGKAKAQSSASADRAKKRTVSFTVNGDRREMEADTRLTLLDALRGPLGLPGSKKGCDHGQCGACTVHVDGQRMLSCFTLVAGLEGKEVTTIEGLANGDELHPLQQAFIDNDAFQCGYCTPGQIMSGVACIAEGHARTPAEIREYMSGNICRCAAYPNIVAAVEQARDAEG
ncbi:(2Fe-2S)-binding protein [Novosphingobium marinum]|uniref:Xanthine dehydrogenase YagT iron-sulfur-binding subunit n=1 Tax=Novosphingobium marinum TaxID=1514948 RepID=A0A7Y9XVL0_9SPHN|nr:(2Fe-2S)-binding protein [Novosphingobium marinum]NYH94170.1 xanthine dehydrogenase YagT iron-sulfur-binding subunit [Novosphingobium marinum]